MKRGDVMWAWCAGAIVWVSAIVLLVALTQPPEMSPRSTQQDVSSRQLGIDNWFHEQWQQNGSVPITNVDRNSYHWLDTDEPTATVERGP